MTESGQSETTTGRANRFRSVLRSRNTSWILFGLTVVAVILAPLVLGDSRLTLLTVVAQFAIAVVGLTLLYGQTGQLSLGQSGFMSIGAYTSAILTADYGWSSLLAMLTGSLVAAVAALLVGYPLLRLRNFYLTIATLGFALIVTSLIVGLKGVTGGPSGHVVPPFEVLGYQFVAVQDQYFLAWTFLAVILVGLAGLLRSSRGRALRAIGRDELSAATMGVPVFRYKMGVFVASGVLGALAGSLYAHTLNFVGAELLGPHLSLELVIMNFLGGASSLLGAVLGAGVLLWLPSVSSFAHENELILSGLILVVVLRFLPEGVVPALARFFRFAPILRAADSSAELEREAEVESGAHDGPEGSEGQVFLSAKNFQRSFSGVKAVQGVSCDVRTGQIKSLVGPNGAGKTTFLNLITGVVVADAGELEINGMRLTDPRPATIAAMGVGRTYQTPRLYVDGSVLENVLMGTFRLTHSPLWATLLWSPSFRREEARLQAIAMECLAAVGLEGVADISARSLPLGTQRRLEIARALACGPTLIVLDEPAAGSNEQERFELGELLLGLRAAGAAVLLVEHNMDLVMSVSDEVQVMDRGREIATGSPEAIIRDPKVIEAYLGIDHGTSAALGEETT